MLILGSDFDGTLSQNGVSEEARRAIHDFRCAGNFFGIVTGRDYELYPFLAREQIELDFMLALNGAMAIAPDGSYLYCEHAKNNGCVGKIAELIAKKYGSYLSCVCERKRVTFRDVAEPDGNGTFPFSMADGLVPEFTMLNTYFPSEETARAVTGEVNERFGNAVNALQNGNCVDIPPAGVDKGQGLLRVAQLLRVPESNIYAAGDNLNDFAMVSRFHGCAMSGGREELKASAEFVFPTIDALIRHLMP